MLTLRQVKTRLIGNISYRPTTIAQRRYDRPISASLDGMETPSYSLVIPTRNRPDSLARCLDSVLAQTIKPKEVIIIDNGDKPLQVEDQFAGSGIDLTYTQCNTPGTARARNIGIANSSGDIVSFVDDDSILSPNYMEELLKIFVSDEEHEVGGVDGFVLNDFEYVYNIQRFIKLFFSLYPYAISGVVLPSGFHHKIYDAKHPAYTEIFGGVAAYRREVFNTHQYDEINFPGYTLGEDSEFAYRVSQDYQLVTTPYAKFIHAHAPSGRPSRFKLGAQCSHAAFRTMRLNKEIGIVNVAFLLWFLSGYQAYRSVALIKNPSKGNIAEFFGRIFGISTLPLNVASKGPKAKKLVNWLSQVEKQD